MTGIALKISCLDRMVEEFKDSPDELLQSIAAVVEAAPSYAVLGTIGPALADLMPTGTLDLQGERSKNPHLWMWTQLVSIMGNNAETCEMGLISALGQIDEELKSLRGQTDVAPLDKLTQGRDLSGRLAHSTSVFNGLISKVEALGLDIIALVEGNPSAASADTAADLLDRKQWHGADLLHWRKSACFAAQLIRRSADSGDPLLQAYTYGYLVGHEMEVAGNTLFSQSQSSFLAMGPQETSQIRLFVCEWLEGVNEETASALSDLQARIELSNLNPMAMIGSTLSGIGRDHVDPGFAALWFESYRDTFGEETTTKAGLTPSSIHEAYHMLWSILWMMTGENPLTRRNSAGASGDAGEFFEEGSHSPRTFSSESQLGEELLGTLGAMARSVGSLSQEIAALAPDALDQENPERLSEGLDRFEEHFTKAKATLVQFLGLSWYAYYIRTSLKEELFTSFSELKARPARHKTNPHPSTDMLALFPLKVHDDSLTEHRDES